MRAVENCRVEFVRAKSLAGDEGVVRIDIDASVSGSTEREANQALRDLADELDGRLK